VVLDSPERSGRSRRTSKACGLVVYLYVDQRKDRDVGVTSHDGTGRSGQLDPFRVLHQAPPATYTRALTANQADECGACDDQARRTPAGIVCRASQHDGPARQDACGISFRRTMLSAPHPDRRYHDSPSAAPAPIAARSRSLRTLPLLRIEFLQPLVNGPS